MQLWKVVLSMFGLLGSRSSSSKAPALRAPEDARARAAHLRGLRRPGLKPSLALAPLLLLAFAGSAAAAQPRVNLGTADSYAVLAGPTIMNTGNSVLNGNFGVSPGNACTGFRTPCTGGGPGIVNGTIHAGDANSLKAKNDYTTAYNSAAGRTPFTNVVGDLGGQTLTPGVYRSPSTQGLTGQLTLNALGNPNAVFIFQVPSALTTATDSSVRLINGTQACNVYWQLGTDATLGTRTAFKGTVLAARAIDVNNAVDVQGRLFAGTAALTLANDRITRPQCAPGTTGGTPLPAGGGAPDTGSDSGSGPADHRGPLARVLHLPGVRQVPARRPGTRRPRASSVCTKHSFTASVRLRDRSGIRRVRVYVDGKLVRRSTHTRFSLRVNVRGLRVGRHRLTVVARDRAGNRSVTRRHFGRCALAAAAPRFTG